ncbi:porin family protein, partial [Alcanivorax sp. 1008]|uniref:porin family protein n=1 Tax=Alcanivorax sp. 1008 TaxID=2816853 RepID=UPI001D660081
RDCSEELLADISAAADGNDASGVTMDVLNGIIGLTGVDPSQLAYYQEAIADADASLDSLEELQAIIDSVNDQSKDVVVSKGGVGSFNFLWLSLMSGLLAFRKANVRAVRPMLYLLAGASVSGQALANNAYFGIGAGVSDLEPNTEQSLYEVSEEQGTAFQIFTGYQFNDHWSVDLSYMDLGSAELENASLTPAVVDVDYSALSVGGMYHFEFSKDDACQRHCGLDPFITLGLSDLNVDAGTGLSEDSSTLVRVGLGADYALNDGWALRFMATSFSEDAVAFSINIMKRFNVSD